MKKTRAFSKTKLSFDLFVPNGAHCKFFTKNKNSFSKELMCEHYRKCRKQDTMKKVSDFF